MRNSYLCEQESKITWLFFFSRKRLKVLIISNCQVLSRNKKRSLAGWRYNFVPHFESKDPTPQKVMRFGNIMEAKVTPLTQNYILNTNAARSLVTASVRANVSIHFHFMQNTI